MSLSRPVNIPLLKLPYLCIEAVVKSWDVFGIIFFALISLRTRRIVKHLKIPLNKIELFLSKFARIVLNSRSEQYRNWLFRNESEWLSDQNSRKYPLVFRNNKIPLYISKTDDDLVSYVDGNETAALIMAMEFLNETFKCSVERVRIQDYKLPESGDIGVKSIVNLCIGYEYDNTQNQKLNLLMKNLEVTDTCTFWVKSTEKDFYVDPKLFKCKKLMFSSGSAAWVNKEILMQLEVPQLIFYNSPFSVEDVLSFVTHWFHTDDKKLEYLYIDFRSRQISLENFQTKELNPVPFSGRNRFPPLDSFRYVNVDFSKGLEIVLNDGLQATIHVGKENFMFYIWHDQ
ncbi:unnamed protein product [Caenorhabditis brenneri]